MIVGDLITKERGGSSAPTPAPEPVARTEASWAANQSEVATWSEAGVKLVQIFDGVGCGWNGA